MAGHLGVVRGETSYEDDEDDDEDEDEDEDDDAT